MEVKIIRSNRKTVAIQINNDLSVTVRAPKKATKKDIEKILRDKEPWIQKHMEQVKNTMKKYEEKGYKRLTDEQVYELAKQALEYIPRRVEYFANIMGVDYKKITIRNQKTRWGSCSQKGNLNFNCLLMLMPPEVIDYVVVHELCHRKEMNHSKQFWNEVEKILPYYKEAVMWLKSEGSLIARQLE